MSVVLNKESVDTLFAGQLASWEQAAGNYEALKGVKTKDVIVDGFPFKVQFNPARIVSSAAKVDAKSIQERKCFLCKENRPSVQEGIDYIYNNDSENPYTVLINPFPIFPRHLTIPLLKHQDQLIGGRMGAMLKIAELLPDFTLFYNGPKCGASAPDHFHFQAGNRGFLPIESEFAHMDKEVVWQSDSSAVGYIKAGINGVIFIESKDKSESEQLFDKVFSVLDIPEGEREPMVNILCWYDGQKWYTLLYLRSKHRPSHYFEEGEKNILLSPASVDLGGVLITPLEKDFVKVGETEIKEILGEILVSNEFLLTVISKLKSIL